jgi:hypothetical protein
MSKYESGRQLTILEGAEPIRQLKYRGTQQKGQNVAPKKFGLEFRETSWRFFLEFPNQPTQEHRPAAQVTVTF